MPAKNKIVYIMTLIAFFLVHNKLLFARHEHAFVRPELIEGQLNSSWFDCIDRETCRALSSRFKSKLRGGYSEDDALGAAVSGLLAEYLRESGEPVNLGVIENLQHVLPPFISLSAGGLAEGKSKGGRYGMTMTLVDDLIKAVMGDKGAAQEILNEQLIPAIALKMGEGFLAGGRCRPALKYFDRLMERYDRNSRVVSGWAGAKMDCGDYSDKIHKKLRRIYKNNQEDYTVIAQIVRYLNHKKDFEKIINFVSKVEPDRLSGKAGSDLLAELARFEMERNKTTRARAFLKNALTLNPQNATAHLLLGKSYLLIPKDLPRAIASLKTYNFLTKNSPEAEEIRTLVAELEGDLEKGLEAGTGSVRW